MKSSGTDTWARWIFRFLCMTLLGWMLGRWLALYALPWLNSYL